MSDEELINELSNVIVMSEEEINNIQNYLVEYQKKYDFDFNVQTIINMCYSVIELTDGIYSLTYDKNTGSINVLTRIHFETAAQLLVMLDNDYKKNVLSYDYHQYKDMYKDNEYLINNTEDDGLKKERKEQQERNKELLENEKFDEIKELINRLKKQHGLSYSNWFITTEGHPRSILRLISKYFKNDQGMKVYYGYLSKYVHSSNTIRFVNHETYTIEDIRKETLEESSLEIVIITSLTVLLKITHFFMKEFDYIPYKDHEKAPEEIYIKWRTK